MIRVRRLLLSPLVGFTLIVLLFALYFRSYLKSPQYQQNRLFSAEELALYNGTDETLPILLGILGSVFDVTKGKSHYHKGYKLTTQGKSMGRMGWRQVENEGQGAKMLSTMQMETDSGVVSDNDTTHSKDSRLFKREVRKIILEEGTDLHFLREGFITVTPLGALTQVDVGCQRYYEEWLPKITNQPCSSSL